ncbi:DUF1269 domain-containing protein [Rugamonas sp. DEMB1]|jgi:hypothetical protein|uniref:DUF1269 domain-containing protein n=1 Tax=Rugamonas sp. DEMB1 TaxID=3039386 RepID=UPI00244CC166|nr:DUF1269 domain-containing protein [Rugamonas sp. DEMB1]WGG50652.1 DUF1269 domain-containing protein [Rugamonas sp. DEMB1]
MRRRLYFMLPDVPSARAMLDELLLARIEIGHMRFMARDGTLPADMPDVSVLQKTDVVHGAQLGIVIGGIVGLGAGIFLIMFPPEGLTLRTAAILLVALGGALFGGWASGMNAAAVPNSRLAQFAERIEQGQVLMMIDVPVRRVQEIEQMIAKRHPEISFGGSEPPMLAFP